MRDRYTSHKNLKSWLLKKYSWYNNILCDKYLNGKFYSFI